MVAVAITGGAVAITRIAVARSITWIAVAIAIAVTRVAVGSPVTRIGIIIAVAVRRRIGWVGIPIIGRIAIAITASVSWISVSVAPIA